MFFSFLTNVDSFFTAVGVVSGQEREKARAWHSTMSQLKMKRLGSWEELTGTGIKERVELKYALVHISLRISFFK